MAVAQGRNLKRLHDEMEMDYYRLRNLPEVCDEIRSAMVERCAGRAHSFAYRQLLLNSWQQDALLDEVLLAEGIIPEGNIVDGMFTIVDGETASWEADQAYWALFIGEDYAVKGICDTVVEDGGSYKFVYEKSTYWGE